MPGPLLQIKALPLGLHAVSVSDDGEAFVWNCSSGQHGLPMTGHNAPISYLNVSKDGRWLGGQGG